MFDVGEDLRHCDISLCEGTGIGKGFGYDDEVCCWEANFGFGGADSRVAKCNIYKKNCNLSLNNLIPESDLSPLINLLIHHT